MSIKRVEPNYSITCYRVVGTNMTFKGGRKEVRPIYHQHTHFFARVGPFMFPIH